MFQAFRKLDDMCGKLTEQLRKLAKQVGLFPSVPFTLLFCLGGCFLWTDPHINKSVPQLRPFRKLLSQQINLG